jgi:serine phosphatase RsbU (regulator of sigma subunit)
LEYADERLQYWLRPAENFSGDTVASARSAEGTLYALLADATGHGLTAAITIVPVLTLFYRLVEHNYPIGYIAHELNRELMSTLPCGRFVAISLVSLHPETNTLTIWQGGMPDIFHIDNRRQRKASYQSYRLPLGIVDFDDEMAAVQTIAVSPGDRLVIFSDGLIEACNPAGEEFGLKRIERVLTTATPNDLIRNIKVSVMRHLGKSMPHDDVSLLVIDC